MKRSTRSSASTYEGASFQALFLLGFDQTYETRMKPQLLDKVSLSREIRQAVIQITTSYGENIPSHYPIITTPCSTAFFEPIKIGDV